MRHLSSWRFGFLVGVAGCSGVIAEPGEPTSGNPTPGKPDPTSVMPVPPVVDETGNTIKPEPNRVTMRRLNQNEYDFTVRDLLNTTSQPARVFLSDTQTHGFDNNGDLLGLNPTRVDQFHKAAELLADEALKGPARATLLTCDPAAGDTCVRTFVTSFGERAYRRPLTEEEIAGYVTLAGKARTAMATPDEVVRTVIEAILMSPHFLFKVEIDPDPTSLTPHAVTPFELASRLSYTIYGSMPDEPLMASAKAGRLTDTNELADPKGRFAQIFAQQWLDVRNIDAAQPDPKLFPTWNGALAASMKGEVDMFVDDLIKNNRPAEDILLARYSFLDDKLGRHYGVTVPGTTMARADLTTDQRGGVLSMGALMTATSRGARTSPVDRGRWVLDALLCEEPPPPPADLVLPSEEQIQARTAREFLAEHRKNATCAACHNLMDPIGLALENYDAVGAWRTMDRGQPIDPAGQLADGTMITGPRHLAEVIAKDKRFRACVTQSLLTFATGRTTHETDKPYIQHIAKGTGGATVGVKDLLAGVVLSDAFRMRRGESAAMGGSP
jgi:hypothetical protein